MQKPRNLRFTRKFLSICRPGNANISVSLHTELQSGGHTVQLQGVNQVQHSTKCGVIPQQCLVTFCNDDNSTFVFRAPQIQGVNRPAAEPLPTCVVGFGSASSTVIFDGNFGGNSIGSVLQANGNSTVTLIRTNITDGSGGIVVGKFVCLGPRQMVPARGFNLLLSGLNTRRCGGLSQHGASVNSMFNDTVLSSNEVCLQRLPVYSMQYGTVVTKQMPLVGTPVAAALKPSNIAGRHWLHDTQCCVRFGSAQGQCVLARECLSLPSLVCVCVTCAGGQANLLLINSTLKSLHSKGDGAAIGISGNGRLRLVNTSLHNCSSSSRGGAIAAVDYAFIMMQNSSVTSCSAVQVGIE
jgi:hypothetical protein